MTDRPCTCPSAERPLGRLHGVSMGRGMVRLSTTPGCPEHDSCHGWTKQRRAGRPAWSKPWCPIHGTRECPEQKGTNGMKIWVQPHGQKGFEIDWPDGWRVPMLDEWLLLAQGHFRVDIVQWEATEDPPSVQLRVSTV